jgi:hypothetical protein
LNLLKTKNNDSKKKKIVINLKWRWDTYIARKNVAIPLEDKAQLQPEGDDHNEDAEIDEVDDVPRVLRVAQHFR